MHRCRLGLHRCKTVFRWCKRLLGDLCSLSPKRPFSPSSNYFWVFLIFEPLSQAVWFPVLERKDKKLSGPALLAAARLSQRYAAIGLSRAMGLGCLNMKRLGAIPLPLACALEVRYSETGRIWETDFYTPPVLGGAALFGNSAPAVYKILGP